MKTSVLAFIFDQSLKQVLLVHKQTPTWQAGKINGVGGKIEAGETPLATVVRETAEETRLSIPESDWTEIATLAGPTWHCTVFGTVYRGRTTAARQGAHEAIAWYPVTDLPANILTNLTWLIPLALDELSNQQLAPVQVKYH